MRRIISLTAAVLLLSGIAVACGDDGGGDTTDIAAFCAQAERLDERFDALDDDDPAALKTAVNELRGIAVPSEIRDDWTLVMNAMSSFADVFAGIDPENPEEAMAAFEELASLEQEFEGVQEANDRITAFVEEECGISIGD